MTRTPGRRLAAAVTMIAAALALSGCMKMHVDITLKPDDTANATMIVALDKTLAETMGQDPAALTDQMTESMLADSPENTKVEPYSDDKYVGAKMTMEGAPLDELGSLDQAAGSEEALSITREGDEFVVTGTMDLSEGTAGTDAMTQNLMKQLDIKVSVTFPGAVKSHDGELDGTTVTWTPKPGESTPVNARGSAVASGLGALGLGGGSSSSLLIWGLVALVVLAAAAVVVVVLVRKKQQAAPVGAATSGVDDGLGAPPATTPAGETWAPSAPGQPAGPVQQTPPAPPAPPVPPTSAGPDTAAGPGAPTA